ncbi:hypothetical protein FV218_04555, partial [Methylobacterium sp. WL69]
ASPARGGRRDPAASGRERCYCAGRPYPGRPYPGRPYPGRPYPGRPCPGAPCSGPSGRCSPADW